MPDSLAVTLVFDLFFPGVLDLDSRSREWPSMRDILPVKLLLELFFLKYYGTKVNINITLIRRSLYTNAAFTNSRMLLELFIYTLFNKEAKIFKSTFAPLRQSGSEKFVCHTAPCSHPKSTALHSNKNPRVVQCGSAICRKLVLTHLSCCCCSGHKSGWTTTVISTP